MAYSTATQEKITEFFVKAQDKIGQFSTAHAERIKNEKKVNPNEVNLSEDLSHFMDAVDNYYNTWSEKQITQYIDFWSNKAELDKINYVARGPLANPNIDTQIINKVFPDIYVEDMTFVSPVLTLFRTEGLQQLSVDLSALVSGLGGNDGVITGGTLVITPGSAIINVTRSEGLPDVPIDVSSLLGVVLTYDPVGNQLTLARADGSTDVRDLDNAIKSLSFSTGTNKLSIVMQGGETAPAPIDLSSLKDPEVTGGSFNASTKVLTLTKASGGADVNIPLNGVLTTGDVINNLSSSSVTSPLAANQGRILDQEKADKDAIISNKASSGNQNNASATTARSINTIYNLRSFTLQNTSSESKNVEVRGKVQVRAQDNTPVVGIIGIHTSVPTTGNYVGRGEGLSFNLNYVQTVYAFYEDSLSPGQSKTYYLSCRSTFDSWFSDTGYLVAKTV